MSNYVRDTSDEPQQLQGEELQTALKNSTVGIATWGDRALNSIGLDSYDVTIQSLDAEHAEDAAHSSGDKGVSVLVVRNDALASLADADGDYTVMQVGPKGALYARLASIDDTAGIENSSGTKIDPATEGTASSIDTSVGNLEQTEDTAHSTGDSGIGVLAVRNDVLASLVDTDGDYAPLQVNANGALYVDVSDSEPLDVSGATVTVEQNTPVQLEDSGGTNIDPRQQGTYAVEYTSVDENTTGTTTLYSPTNDAKVSGVHLNNPGSTAELRLEVTDGTSTAVLSDPGAGTSIAFNDEIFLSGGTDQLQVVVEAAEGSSQSETAAVSRSEL